MKTGNLWDIFCRVIDNYGDIGVGWRLATGLAARGQQVRLWLDDASALNWMAPEGAPGVEVKPWTQPLQIGDLHIGDILVEAFGCEVAPEFIAAYKNRMTSTGQKPLWLNLEYLTAEGFAERSHGLPSPVMTGPGVGLTKHFFYPGFSAATGGLLREPDLAERQSRFDRLDWLQQRGIELHGERLVSLFCYEPPALGELLDRLSSDPCPTRLLVTAGRATAAVQACIDQKARSVAPWNSAGKLSFSYLPALRQSDFDCLLWACDLNFVRGEDSLVRALWAGKAFVWQLYPQQDDAHHHKLEAFLNLLKAPPSLRAFHRVWNGASQAILPAPDLTRWQQTASAARKLQLEQDDLVTKIMRFVSKNR